VCPYCDFAVTTGAPEHERYLDAVLAELAARAPRFSGELVSIYLGGGTPSLWEPDCIARAIAEIRATFGGAPREITLEANPIDCTQLNCARWKSAGVTRVSIGVQSIAADELVVLGRDHRFGDGPAALEHALAAGFATSCDLIMGTPTGRTPDLTSVDALAATAVDHLSIYELTIEDRTAFGARVRDGRLIPLDDDVLAELYEAVDARLAAAGFEHYEISSYARAGKRAVHNSLYWACTPFVGLGVGAASLEVRPDGSGTRATNPRKLADYYAGAPPDVVASTPGELRAERAWLGMRTRDGVAEADLPLDVVRWLVDERLATRAGGRICPSLRGFLLANRIAARIAEAL
jgi:oxygen-independent coproporphyrinogen III oxidase